MLQPPELKRAQAGGMKRDLRWRKCGEQLADHFHIRWLQVTRALHNIFGDGIDCSFMAVYPGNIAAHLFNT